MHTDAGHRQRVKNRYRKEGLDGFDEVHALELLLFYAVPRIDTKPLARTLLDRFGSLALVLEATAEELTAVSGVGENVATYLTLITAAGRYYQKIRSDRPVILDSTANYSRYLMDMFYGKRNEVVFALCLDAKCKVLCCREIGEGDVNCVNVPIRKVVEIALSTNATLVILAHNHPGGLAIPSGEDIETTERIARALGAMDIILADHVIISDNECTSMVQSHCYDPRQFSRLI